MHTEADLNLDAEAANPGGITIKEAVVPSVPVSRPDITPAQVVAVLTALIGQAVAYGVLDAGHAQAAVHQVTLDVPLIWIAADAVLRFGRNIAHGLKS